MINVDLIRNCQQVNYALECVVHNAFNGNVELWSKCSDIPSCPLGYNRELEDPATAFKGERKTATEQIECKMLQVIKTYGNAGKLQVSEWEITFIKDMLKKTSFSEKQSEIIKKIYGRCNSEA